MIFMKGLLLGFSLIVPVGTQNAFAIRQGLRRELVFFTALIFTLCDCVLISIGVLGAGHYLAQNPIFKLILTIGGAVYLLIYSGNLLFNLLKRNHLLVQADNNRSNSLAKVATQAILFSWLNPHAIIDTVVIIGSVVAQYRIKEGLIFGCGTIVSSCIWFFLLCYGARTLSSLFKRSIFLITMDIAVAAICIWISIGLFHKSI